MSSWEGLVERRGYSGYEKRGLEMRGPKMLCCEVAAVNGSIPNRRLEIVSVVWRLHAPPILMRMVVCGGCEAVD